MPQSNRIEWQEISVVQDAVRQQDAIDALKWLAGEFQRQGMVECAVVLDRAFQECLQLYVNRQMARLERQMSADTAGSVKIN